MKGPTWGTRLKASRCGKTWASASRPDSRPAVCCSSSLMPRMPAEEAAMRAVTWARTTPPKALRSGSSTSAAALVTGEGMQTTRPLKVAAQHLGVEGGQHQGDVAVRAEGGARVHHPGARGLRGRGQLARDVRRRGQQHHVHALEGVRGGLGHLQRLVAVLDFEVLGALGAERGDILGGDAGIEEGGEHLAAHDTRGPHHRHLHVLFRRHGASLYVSRAPRASPSKGLPSALSPRPQSSLRRAVGAGPGSGGNLGFISGREART